MAFTKEEEGFVAKSGEGGEAAQKAGDQEELEINGRRKGAEMASHNADEETSQKVNCQGAVGKGMAQPLLEGDRKRIATEGPCASAEAE